MKFNSFDIIVYPTVYPPSDDSYLLYDYVDLKGTRSFLEIGCGTGVLTLKAAKSVDRIVAIDVSLDAVQNTMENLERNGLGHRVSVLQCDLLSALDDDTKFGVIACNPPYLPKGEARTDLDDALVGGERGNEIIKELIHGILTHLEEGGVVYLVISSLSQPDEVIQLMRVVGLEVETVAEKNLFFEKLLLLKGTMK